MNIRKRIVFAECNCLEFQLINAEFLCHSSAKGDLLSFAMKVDPMNKLEVLFSSGRQSKLITVACQLIGNVRNSAQYDRILGLIQSGFEYIARTDEISERQQRSDLCEWLWFAPVFRMIQSCN
jgi:hypothetical protein